MEVEVRRRALGIFHSAWSNEYGDSSLKRRTLRGVHGKAVWRKANPRNEEYMKGLFRSRWPEGDYVNADSDPQWYRRVPSANPVILLYPDAIGLGFQAVESRVLGLKKDRAAVHVLNGRRREYPFSRRMRGRLYFHRFLERWMIGEILMTFLFLLVTPVLLLRDWTARRR